jgi:lipopolysaccharide/colanic/teichoic acid biosynthesis glycosyltransferase
MDRAVIRLLDLMGALILAAITALPMALIALAIRLQDGGPALFCQTRIGRDCRPFTVLKFRTMRIDRERSGEGVVDSSRETLAEASARFQRTVPGDPRITRRGRLLRPSPLGALPQLLNVLRGDMSLVGVRPDTPVQEADYTPEYWRLRHRYRPGLTGPAQLRTDPLTFEMRNSEEMGWIENYGPGLYLTVLCRTALMVIRRSSF